MLESSISHIVILMTLFLAIIKDLRNSSLIFTPKELTIAETTESTSVASYFDLLFTKDENSNITTKLYDKCDAFGFQIVNFPFMSSNISSAPAYGVYASQFIRYARCCSNYSNFLSRHRALVTKLLIVCPTRLRNSMADTHLYNTRKMSVKCLLIVPVKMTFFRFVKVELIKLAKMAGFMHEANHAYSIRSTWRLHRLATDVPSIACVINWQSIFVYNSDLANFLLESGLSYFDLYLSVSCWFTLLCECCRMSLL